MCSGSLTIQCELNTQINIEAGEARDLVAQMQVDVKPTSFAVDKTLRFHHWCVHVLFESASCVGLAWLA